jgi:hypothetical protein
MTFDLIKPQVLVVPSIRASYAVYPLRKGKISVPSQVNRPTGFYRLISERENFIIPFR